MAEKGYTGSDGVGGKLEEVVEQRRGRLRFEQMDEVVSTKTRAKYRHRHVTYFSASEWRRRRRGQDVAQ